MDLASLRMIWLPAAQAQARRLLLCELSIVMEACEFARSHSMPTFSCGSGSRFEGLCFTKFRDSAAFLPHPLVQQTMHDQLSPNKTDTEFANSTRRDPFFFAPEGTCPVFSVTLYTEIPRQPLPRGAVE